MPAGRPRSSRWTGESVGGVCTPFRRDPNRNMLTPPGRGGGGCSTCRKTGLVEELVDADKQMRGEQDQDINESGFQAVHNLIFLPRDMDYHPARWP